MSQTFAHICFSGIEHFLYTWYNTNRTYNKEIHLIDQFSLNSYKNRVHELLFDHFIQLSVSGAVRKKFTTYKKFEIMFNH